MLHLPLFALVAAKIADIGTTVRGVGRLGGSGDWKRNSLDRWALRRFGPGGGIAFAILLWSLVVALYIPAWVVPAWRYQWATAAGGIAVAWAQWDVTRFNATHRHSRFTQLMLRRYGKSA